MRRTVLSLTGLIACGALLVACGAPAPTAPTSAPSATTVPAVTLEPTAEPAATETIASVATEAATQSPEATSAEATATTGAEAATTPVASADAQLYKIDPAQSEARYQVDELLFAGNRLATAVGRTKGISGDIMIDFAQPASSKIGEISIDVSQLTSDENRRDNFIRRTGLESSSYPLVKFVPTSIEGLPDQVTVGDQFDVMITGDMTVKETTKPVTWKTTIKVEDGKVSGSASTEILMSDFGVGPLQVPLLRTEDKMLLSLDFVATPAQA